MDYLTSIAVGNFEAAKTILRKLGLGLDVAAPEPSNNHYQSDGWSCGFHVVKWIELDLRQWRGEPRLGAPSIGDLTVRTNHFITKIKDVFVTLPLAAPKPACKPKTSKPTAEPQWATLEEALDAGLKCSKCLRTKQGAKGCRACMRAWFEHIRMKASGKQPLP